jgi:hypothetical protein
MWKLMNPKEFTEQKVSPTFEEKYYNPSIFTQAPSH